MEAPSIPKLISVSLQITDDNRNSNEQKSNDRVTSNPINIDSQQRNKRMLAGILGHLNSAKKRLETDTNEKSKLSDEKCKRDAQRQQILSIQKELQNISNEISNIHEEIKFLTDEKNVYNKYQEQISFFLESTAVSESKILWLPKSHNQATKNILNIKKRKCDVLVAEKEMHFKKSITPLQNRICLLHESQTKLNNELDALK